MKFTNWIIDKFGVDKMLHFMGGAFIVAVLSPFGWLGVMTGFILMLILSFVKEQYLDSEFDKRDIIAAVCGGLVSIILYSVINLIL